MQPWTYSRCPNCPDDHRQVFPDGPLDARIMAVGEGPGVWEDKSGIPFCGRAGQELDETYLHLAGLTRGEVFATNCVQCRQERNGVDVRPAAALVSSCAKNHLWEEIWAVWPEIIILCGAVACSLAGDVDLELEHGFPRRVENCEGLGGWSGWVVPMYHPAAGMHETRYMTPLLEDWERFGMWLRGKWQPPSVESSDLLVTDYKLLTDEADVLRSLRHPVSDLYEYLAIDTESDEGRPWSIQYSVAPGVARMILFKDRRLLEAFALAFEWEWGGKCTLHNAPADLGPLEEAGASPHEFRDTMQELYHLGNLPQGLKAATYRTSGHRMTSYNETVVPHSKAALDGWLAESLAHVSEHMQSIVTHPIGKGCPVCGKSHRKELLHTKPHEAEAVLRRIMSKLSDGSDYDPWQAPKWQKGEEKCRLLGRPWLEGLEQVVGRMPRKSIVHVPIEEAVRYGCSDADRTGKLALWLERERERIVEEEWRVA